MEITKQYSNMFFVAKAFGCLLIVLSHMPFGNSMPFESLRLSIGQVGVYVFFICAGYFYKKGKCSYESFWKKKLITIVIPWILFSTFTFLISRIVGSNGSSLTLSYLKWIFGVGSCYWYMPALVLCYALFNQICRTSECVEDILLYSCIGTSALSVVLSASSLVEYSLTFNQYTNIFNWIGVFALGVFIRKKQLIVKLCSLKSALVALPLFVVFVFLSTKRMATIEAYIDKYSIPIEIFGCICIFVIAKILNNCGLLIDIGKKSFFVYLMHIQVAGMINTRLPYNVVFFALRPFIAVVACYIFAKAIEWALIKTKWHDRIGSLLALR